MSAPTNILVIQTAFIGDVILATALLENLHQRFPNAKISMLVRKGNESLLNNHPFLHDVLVWDKRKNKWKNLLAILAVVRRNKYDLVVNLQRFFSSGFVTAFSLAREKVGYINNPLSRFFDRKIEHKLGHIGKAGLHEVQRNQQLIAHLCGGDASMPKLYPVAKDEALVSEYVNAPFVTISPASVWFTKQTPKSVWIDFIQQLDKSYTIYLLGGPSDQALCDEIVSAASSGQVVSLAGKLTLLQSAALMSKAAMNYTNDSAPMHLCSAMNAPVTAVYCSTIPEFGFGPLSKKSFVVQHKGHLSCKPCGLHGHRACPQKHFTCGAIDSADLLNSVNVNIVQV